MARLLIIGPPAYFLPLICDALAQEGVPVTEAANTYEGLAPAAAAWRGAGRGDIAYLVIDDHVPDLPPAGGSLRAKRISMWDWGGARRSVAAVRHSLLRFWHGIHPSTP